ncbi:Fur family transcriptional regulator [Burkholderia gladioli]|uniref:Fur family transcriptional regulator n=1 Tax=Burkholderia gladioli TaxID=28095 RepID=UPI00164043AC|nr:Fur family transcriptional regulator [Burkholderia gladioli]
MKAIYSELKRVQMRPTAARVAVLKLFHDEPAAHYTVDQVFQALSGEMNYSLSSIYRALANLQEASLIVGSSVGSAKLVYELNRGEQHIHLVCTRCETIRDLRDPEFERQQARLAAAHGFHYQAYRHVLFGVCADCESVPNAAVH